MNYLNRALQGLKHTRPRGSPAYPNRLRRVQLQGENVESLGCAMCMMSVKHQAPDAQSEQPIRKTRLHLFTAIVHDDTFSSAST
jgi:hypothetical protein